MAKGLMKKLRNLVRSKSKYRRDCFDCGWFHARKPRGNRVCQYVGKLQLRNPESRTIAYNCKCWIPEPDPKRRIVSFIEL